MRGAVGQLEQRRYLESHIALVVMIAGLGIIKPDKTILGVAEGYQFNQDLTLELADRIGALGSQFDVMEFALNKCVDDLGISCSANTTLGEEALLVALVLGVALDVLHDSVLGVIPPVANGEHAVTALGGVPALALGGGVLVADSGLDGSAVDGNKHDSSYRLVAPPWACFCLTGTTIDPFSV